MLKRILALSLVLTWACGKKTEGEPGSKREDSKPSEPEKKPSEGSDGSPAMINMMTGLFASQADQPGPYDAPRESKGYSDDKEHAVIASLDGAIVELQQFSFSGSSGLELLKLADKLDDLAKNKNVSTLLLRVGDLGVALSTAEEVRDRLRDWKTRDGRTRKLLCHIESASTITTYLLSACDVVGLAPGGLMELSGVAAVPVHLKGLLDKLSVRADFLHIGAYKGAAEPLTLDRPSKEMVETIDAILDTEFATLVAGLSENKKLKPEDVKRLIDQAFFFDKAAVDAGLATEVATFEAFRDQHLASTPWKVSTLGGSLWEGLDQITDLLGLAPRPRPTEPHVALVYAVGPVVDDQGGVLGVREQIASKPLSDALRALGRDDAVKAIVLRIDSPGGSALASELIWHAVKEVVARKPVVVSMASVAASGGYYIAAGANRIFAQTTTLTGSIGVVGGRLVIGDALKAIGISAYPQKRGALSTAFLPLAPWSAAEKSKVESLLLGVYDMFTRHVAEGRKKELAAVQSIAQGRVWTGADAVKNGLVDEIGGLHAALAHAQKLGSVAPDVAVEVYPPTPTLMDFVRDFAQARAPLLTLPVGLQLGGRFATELNRHAFTALSFAETPIQTTLWLPAIFP